MDKLVGNHEEPFSTEEIETLIFAFESHILFDSVAHKFLPSLKGLHEIQEIAETDQAVDTFLGNEEKKEINHELVERSEMTKAILLSAIKEHILNDMRMRFGA
ncbi:hypothetical protein [Paenibacillus sp. TC-CSREp1]